MKQIALVALLLLVACQEQVKPKTTLGFTAQIPLDELDNDAMSLTEAKTLQSNRLFLNVTNPDGTKNSLEVFKSGNVDIEVQIGKVQINSQWMGAELFAPMTRESYCEALKNSGNPGHNTKNFLESVVQLPVDVKETTGVVDLKFPVPSRNEPQTVSVKLKDSTTSTQVQIVDLKSKAPFRDCDGKPLLAKADATGIVKVLVPRSEKLVLRVGSGTSFKDYSFPTPKLDNWLELNVKTGSFSEVQPPSIATVSTPAPSTNCQLACPVGQMPSCALPNAPLNVTPTCVPFGAPQNSAELYTDSESTKVRLSPLPAATIPQGSIQSFTVLGGTTTHSYKWSMRPVNESCASNPGGYGPGMMLSNVLHLPTGNVGNFKLCLRGLQSDGAVQQNPTEYLFSVVPSDGTSENYTDDPNVNVVLTTALTSIAQNSTMSFSVSGGSSATKYKFHVRPVSMPCTDAPGNYSTAFVMTTPLVLDATGKTVGTYKLCLRGVQSDNMTQEIPTEYIFAVAPAGGATTPTLSFNSAPPIFTNQSSITVNLMGDVNEFSYIISGSNICPLPNSFSGFQPFSSSSPVSISGYTFSNGTKHICIVGKNSAGHFSPILHHQFEVNTSSEIVDFSGFPAWNANVSAVEFSGTVISSSTTHYKYVFNPGVPCESATWPGSWTSRTTPLVVQSIEGENNLCVIGQDVNSSSVQATSAPTKYKWVFNASAPGPAAPGDLSLWLKADQGVAGGMNSSFAAAFPNNPAGHLKTSSDSELQINGDFSLVAWVNLGSATSVSHSLISKTSSIDGNPAGLEYNLSYSNSSEKFRFQVSNGTLFSSPIGTNMSVEPNTWYLLVGTFDASTNQIKLRVRAPDGLKQPTATPTVAAPRADTADFRVGASQSSGTSAKITNVGIWQNHALTDAEIESLYSGGQGKNYSQLEPALKTNLSAYWNLNELDGVRKNSVTAGLHDLFENDPSSYPILRKQGPNANGVNSWNDSSPTPQAPLEQPSAASQPYFDDNSAIDGKPALQFGDGKLFRSPTFVAPSNCFVAVLRPIKSPTDMTLFEIGNNFNYKFVLRSSQQLLLSKGNGSGFTHSVQTPTPVFAFNQNTILMACIEGSDVSIYNETGVLVTQTIDSFPSGSYTMSLGSKAAGGEFYRGLVAEVFFYNKALSTTERDQTFCYLKNKYNIGAACTP